MVVIHEKSVLGCAVCVYVYLTLIKKKKIFMRSIYTTKYHWNVKPDNVIMMQIMMIVYPL